MRAQHLDRVDARDRASPHRDRAAACAGSTSTRRPRTHRRRRGARPTRSHSSALLRAAARTQRHRPRCRDVTGPLFRNRPITRSDAGGGAQCARASSGRGRARAEPSHRRPAAPRSGCRTEPATDRRGDPHARHAEGPVQRTRVRDRLGRRPGRGQRDRARRRRWFRQPEQQLLRRGRTSSSSLLGVVFLFMALQAVAGPPQAGRGPDDAEVDGRDRQVHPRPLVPVRRRCSPA